MRNREDRSWWHAFGRYKEHEFISLIAPRLGLDACINPEKYKKSSLPDLLVNGALADLKYNFTPFLLAKALYRMDTEHIVPLNRKDFLYYSKNYPDIELYFWVEWPGSGYKISGKTYVVEALSGVWRASLKDIAKQIEAGEAPLHYYKRRVDDPINAKSSYLLDSRKFDCLWTAREIAHPTYCFIDLETTGFLPQKGAVILSIGAITGGGERFYTVIRPEPYYWRKALPRALEINGMTWDKVKNGQHLPVAMGQFGRFLRKMGIVTGKGIIVGQNINFDIRFLKHFGGEALSFAPLDHAIDMRTMYRILVEYKLSPRLTRYSGESIAHALGVEAESSPHHALEGARQVRRSFKKFYAIINNWSVC